MKTIYIADDGTTFDNEFDCTDYEWKINHPCLNDIIMKDEHGKILTEMFSEDTYNTVYTIIVTNEHQVKDLHEFADYTGWVEYYNITKPGTWEWKKIDDYNNSFVLTEEIKNHES